MSDNSYEFHCTLVHESSVNDNKAWQSVKERLRKGNLYGSKRTKVSYSDLNVSKRSFSCSHSRLIHISFGIDFIPDALLMQPSDFSGLSGWVGSC